MFSQENKDSNFSMAIHDGSARILNAFNSIFQSSDKAVMGEAIRHSLETLWSLTGVEKAAINLRQSELFPDNFFYVLPDPGQAGSWEELETSLDQWAIVIPLVRSGIIVGQLALSDARGCDAAHLAVATLQIAMNQSEILRELSQREEMYRTYVELSSDCIWAADLNLNWKYISPSVQKLRGYTPEEAMNQSMAEMFTPESIHIPAQIMSQALAKVMEDPYMEHWPLLIECEETCKNGSSVWCEITASFTRDSTGRIVGVQGITRDISERKKAEAELRYRLDFENTISTLATGFINLPYEKIADGICDALEQTGRFLESDSAAIFLVHPQSPSSMSIKYEWVRPNVKRFPELWQNMDITSYPWLVREMRENQTIIVDDLSHMPEEASEIKKLLLKAEIISAASVSLEVDGRLIGMMVLTRKHDKSAPWSEDTAMLLKIMSGLFANAVVRLRTEEKLKLHQEHLEHLVDERTRALRNSEERFRSIFESTSDGIAVWNRDTSFLYANESARQLQKKIKEDFLLDFLDREDGKRRFGFVAFFNERVKRVLNTMEVIREVSTFNVNDRTLVLDSAFSPIKGIDGDAFAVVALFRDITERRHMEEELLKAKKIETIGVLAGGIAHDFNNFLTTIMLNLSMARIHAEGLGEAGKGIVKKIDAAEKGTFRSKDLAEQLIAFAKGGAPVRSITDLGKVITDCAKFTLSGWNVKCEFDIDSTLEMAHLDAGQIGQVFNNMIINAAQSMPGGGTIHIGAKNVKLPEFPLTNEKGDVSAIVSQELPEGDRPFLMVTIKDQGIGIDPENLEKVFDPFFTTKSKGHGLGLALSYTIITKHGGYIGVSSKPSQGTVFRIFLPAVEKSEIKDCCETPGEVIGGTGRILVMDDEAEIREALIEMLESLGYEAHGENDGTTMIDRFVEGFSQGRPYDLVIMDLTIPAGMGGKEAIRMLRDIDPQVRAVASSGYSNDPIMAKFQDYGFVGIIPKPYDMATLSQVVSKAVRSETASMNRF